MMALAVDAIAPATTTRLKNFLNQNDLLVNNIQYLHVTSEPL